MQVLVVNSGSSSIKFSMYAVERGSAPVELYSGELSGIGAKPEFKFQDANGQDLSGGRKVEPKTVDDAIRAVEALTSDGSLPKVEAGISGSLRRCCSSCGRRGRSLHCMIRWRWR
jgi:acetate kinase